MVPGQDDRRILVKALLLNPVNEIAYLPAGARKNIRVLLAEFVAAEPAGKAVFKVGVDSEEREIERLSAGSQFGQLFFGKIKKLLIFISPENKVVLRDPSAADRIIVILYLIISVTLIEIPSSSEIGA